MVPMIVAVLLTTLLGALGVWGGFAGAERIIGEASSGWGTAGLWALKIVFAAAALLVAILIAVSLAQPLSGWALEGIVRKQDQELGLPQRPEVPFAAQLITSLCVTFAGLAVSVVLIGVLTVIELIFAPAAFVCVPLKFVIGALLIAWDFADYPLGLRDVGVRARLRWMFGNFWAVLSFGLLAAALLMIPCIGLLVLPMGVAGAARLVALTSPERT
jgi:CysZ protein